MASSLQQYTVLYCTIQNALLSEHGKLSVKRSNGAALVKTVAKGLAGISKGAGMVEVSVENAVPAAGFEYDAGDVIEGLVPIEIGVVGPAGKELKFTGYIMEDDLSHAVDSASSYSFSAVGNFAKFR